MASCTLDARFFRLLTSSCVAANGAEHQVQAYACVHPESTLVLFSARDEPLAALTFLSNGGRSRALATCYGDGARFAALARADSVPYSFALTNLTHTTRAPGANAERARFADVGMLKIDLLVDDDDDVRTANLPTRALNEINELRPSQSVLVEADQRAGNRELELRGAMHATSGAALTIAEDRAAPAAERRGTRITVHVTASAAFPALGAALRTSVWRPVEAFVRTMVVSPTPYHRPPPPSSSSAYASMRYPPSDRRVVLQQVGGGVFRTTALSSSSSRPFTFGATTLMTPPTSSSSSWWPKHQPPATAMKMPPCQR
jgi:hypothetical protein